MTDNQDETLYAELTSSFQGRIYMLKAGSEIPLRLSQSTDKPTRDLSPEDNWLQAGGDETPPVFNFEFLSKTEDRSHFNISGTGQNAAKRLGISLNAYLGLYEIASVTDYWKLQPLARTESGLVCAWQDHHGKDVRAFPDVPHFKPGTFYHLNAGRGDVHVFLIKRID